MKEKLAFALACTLYNEGGIRLTGSQENDSQNNNNNDNYSGESGSNNLDQHTRPCRRQDLAPEMRTRHQDLCPEIRTTTSGLHSYARQDLAPDIRITLTSTHDHSKRHQDLAPETRTILICTPLRPYRY